MQIIIDTKNDSPEEIKKAVRFLNSIIENSPESANAPDVTPELFNMFSNEPEAQNNKQDVGEDHEEKLSLETY